MKNIFLGLLALSFAHLTLADGHGGKLAFEQRQASAPMEVTSVHLTETGGTITAEGQMGTYGRTYVTYTLTARPDGKSGWVKVEGRGAMEDGGFASGAGVGIYSRDGTVFTIHFLVKCRTARRIWMRWFLMPSPESCRTPSISFSKDVFLGRISNELEVRSSLGAGWRLTRSWKRPSPATRRLQ